jgi:hypothetical protein
MFLSVKNSQTNASVTINADEILSYQPQSALSGPTVVTLANGTAITVTATQAQLNSALSAVGVGG